MHGRQSGIEAGASFTESRGWRLSLSRLITTTQLFDISRQHILSPKNNKHGFITTE